MDASETVSYIIEITIVYRSQLCIICLMMPAGFSKYTV